MSERLDDSQCERGASNASSGETQGRPFLRKLMDATVERPEPAARIECGVCWRQVPMERLVFFFEDAEQRNGISDWLSGHDRSSLACFDEIDNPVPRLFHHFPCRFQEQGPVTRRLDFEQGRDLADGFLDRGR